MRPDAIAAGQNPPDDINVIIEVPVGGKPVKCELEKASAAPFVDRLLCTPMRYPGSQGFVRHALCGNGDPLDVLVASTRAPIAGSVIDCRAAGVLVTEAESGMDEKVIAVPNHELTKRQDSVRTVADLPAITRRRIEQFFEHYKDLEPGKWVKIVRRGDRREARRFVVDAVEHARRSSRACVRRGAAEPRAHRGGNATGRRRDVARGPACRATREPAREGRVRCLTSRNPLVSRSPTFPATPAFWPASSSTMLTTSSPT
jgi:inorganic pyrophosphatase